MQRACAQQGGLEGTSTPPTPVPWSRIFVVISCIFGDALTMMLVFPFVPFMVRDFLESKDEASVAAFAGLLAGTYKLGTPQQHSGSFAPSRGAHSN